MSNATQSFLRWREIPGSIWALGIVSLLMDLSSEMVHALLPVYLVTVLGASTLTVGIIEGIAEATASVTKVFSGALSDYLGRRKLLAVIGYGLAAITKPMFPLASGVGWIVAARVIDRIGKGIRGAPRDALIADLAPEHVRGASFGLRQALDTVGAFLGPLVAIGLMVVFASDIVSVFWVAVIPAVVAVAALVFWVREPDRAAPERHAVRSPLSRGALSMLGRPFWLVLILATVFTLARFSEAFLILRAQSAGLSLALVPAVLVVMNVVYALSAWPAGEMSDRAGRFGLLAAGMIVLAAADLVLAFADSLVVVGLGVALWGLHMGLTQGILASLIADTAPAELRGTAFGMFNLVTGLAMLAASIVAGALWDAIGPQGTFIAGATFTLFSLAGLPLVRARLQGPRPP